MRTQPEQPFFTVHVDSERGFSGGEVQVFLLLEGLRERGERVLLVAPPGSAAEREACARGIECVPVAMRGEWDLVSVCRLARLLRRYRPHLVHLHTGRANWLGGLAAKLAGVPALTTRRMDRNVKRGLRTKFLYGVLVRRVVAIAGPVGELLLDGGVPADKIEVIHSSISSAALRPALSREQWRAQHGVGPDCVLLLVLANLVHRKGIDLLIDALAHADLQGVKLWIAGEGEQRRALEVQASRLGLDTAVRFLGRQEDKAGLIAACDVVCMPSRREGLGVAALEAMALGRPVLASRVGGLGEAVEDEVSGLLVPPEDVAALGLALTRLVEDAALRARLAAGGSSSLDRGYRVDQMVNAYADLYRRIWQNTMS